DRMGMDLENAGLAGTDQIEQECARLVDAVLSGTRESLGPQGDSPVLEWIETSLLGALEATTDELDSILRALDGRFIAPGPSGAPTRGMAHVLPTGRNFYSLDPRAVPSQLSWEVGKVLADRLVDKYRAEEGRPPVSVGLVVWGTSTMRTAGDDIAQALALLGVEPIWDPDNGRVMGIRVVPVQTLGRPRVGVTLRISGFFRDAFAHLIGLFNKAVAMVGELDETEEMNPIAAECRSAGGQGVDARVFGPKPGAYGSGILGVIESGDWEDDEDLAEVYLGWGGYSYTGDGAGRADPDAIRRRFAMIEVATKNQDNREHDIFDSDDYFQDHGGMIAAIRAITGSSPKAYFGDSSNPARPLVRDLKDEAARVVRTRVINPKWIEAMRTHGYKGAFELAATVDYIFGYDATAEIVEDWMYEKVTECYVADPLMREFFRRSNPHALTSIAERLLEARRRGMWNASDEAIASLEKALLEAEGWGEMASGEPRA
ncbi:MAG TPA: cobaltochelatase subunit CobN, partial [Acidimicrobiales bacterium]|nr:cobaltochelatase subunit CobN [Acidimicrobiales bacterium]